ncbi:MAG: Phosphoribosylformylglycinamidine synthase, PurS subunit [Ignavibacteriae bacterium]|nr:MAG: Phosphoribosylformylglycinamidine synthase, PurS subunit [Ignavibacteriota bacterium]
MYLAKINVVLKKSILDPQGQTILHALENLNYNTVKEVRIGKYIEVKIDVEDQSTAENIVNEISKKLLSNPVMENYYFSLEKL